MVRPHFIILRDYFFIVIKKNIKIISSLLKFDLFSGISYESVRTSIFCSCTVYKPNITYLLDILLYLKHLLGKDF